MSEQRKNSKEKITDKFIKALYITLKRIGELSRDSKLVIKNIQGEIVYFLDKATLKENELLKTAVNEMFSK